MKAENIELKMNEDVMGSAWFVDEVRKVTDSIRTSWFVKYRL